MIEEFQSFSEDHIGNSALQQIVNNSWRLLVWSVSNYTITTDNLCDLIYWLYWTSSITDKSPWQAARDNPHMCTSEFFASHPLHPIQYTRIQVTRSEWIASQTHYSIWCQRGTRSKWQNMLSCARTLATLFCACEHSVPLKYIHTHICTHTHARTHTRTQHTPSDGVTLPDDTHQYYDTGCSDNQADNSSDNGTSVCQWGLHGEWGGVTVVANSLSWHGLNL